MDKREIRQMIKDRKQRYTRSELGALSFAVMKRLYADPRFLSADTVFLYYSMPDEVDTHQIVNTLYTVSKKVLLPRVVDDRVMALIPYNGADGLKAAGKYNILEPQGEPFVDYDKIDLAIIPGVAFTRDGKRLGRGRGYYDRMLPLLKNAYKIGICFPFQIMEDIPTDSYDVLMDTVISPEP